MRIEVKEYRSACDLPNAWDELAVGNVYLSRQFLRFIEKTEKDYFPTYYLFYVDEKADSCFVTHQRKKYNLTMFTKFNFPITATLVYLPMSVTQSSMVVGRLKEEVFRKIQSLKGYKMCLNLPLYDLPDFAVGLTCPKCILNLPFSTFDEYVGALRSDYRNRYKKIMKRSQELSVRFIDPKTEFTDNLYALYINVLKRSRLRIETLSKEYFMGEPFRIFVIEHQGKAVGFVQLLPNASELIFEFVGVDYAYNETHSVYHRMLYEIIRYGIEQGYQSIDFGQTADDTKLKLGCRYEMLYAALHHNNPILRTLCKKIAPKIEYKPITTKFNVFKENPD